MSCGRGMASTCTQSSVLTSTSDESWFSEISEMMDLAESSVLSESSIDDWCSSGWGLCNSTSTLWNVKVYQNVYIKKKIDITLSFNMKTLIWIGL